MKKSRVAVAAIGALLATGVEAATYVLEAAKWGPAQTAAVAAAGGTVTYSNEAAGLASAESDNPDFAQAVVRGGAVFRATPDMVVQWTQPLPIEALPEAIDPSDDTFFTNVQWAPQSVQAPAAWALGFTGRGVRVAVIDGGIFAAHPDLAGNVDVAASRSFVVGGATGFGGCSPQAFNCDTGTFWHGTHVAGIVAARDNSIGVVGIAPEATIVGVKALHSGSGAFSWIINAILYAATDGEADIINMSLGAEFPKNLQGAGPLVAALNRAVNFANARGVLVVVSAGNSGLDTDATANLTVVPAESGAAIAVSATGPLGFALGATNFSRPASYSNFGNALVWIAGPGGDAALPGNALCSRPPVLNIPCWVFDLVLSTSRGLTANGGFSFAAGTSMAAPAVAAVAALIKQRNPAMDAAQLKTELARSATDEGKVGQDNFYGSGYVNALRAVTQ